METTDKARCRTRRVVAVLAAGLLLALAWAPAASAEGGGTGDPSHRHHPRVPGMVIVESDRDVETTWSALLAALDANPNIRTVATIDHAAAAASVGLELAPNRVVVFGNPNLGTPLMQTNQTTGIDLPQKIQVFEHRGRVWVGFNDATYLRARHDLGDQPSLDVIAGALRNLTAAATGREVASEPGRRDAAGVHRFAKRPGLVTVASDADVDTTWDRLLAAIDASPASVAFTVDHQAGAASVGRDLRPTRLVVFGNPNLGTPLMQKRPTAGIDLPLKFLVWEDADGQTFVTTNGMPLARRHRLNRSDLSTIRGAVKNFLRVATVTPAP